MSALEEASLRIPEDISVIGIDDISFASLARPPLTTIRVPREAFGGDRFRGSGQDDEAETTKGGGLLCGSGTGLAQVYCK
jgi:hypothetical protein